CVNLVSVHPSIGMLKRLVVLNLRDCKRLQKFPSRVEMNALQVLNLTGSAIIELPSFVSSLINLESLSFGGQAMIQPTWWTSITSPFGLLSKQHHLQRSVSLAGLQKLKDLNLSYCNLEQVPESIGDLPFLEYLNFEGNNFTSLPGSLSQLSHLDILYLNGCKKLEVLAGLPPRLQEIDASDCTSLREIPGSSKVPFRINNVFLNCPKLFKKTQCLNSSIHQICAFLGYLGFQTNRCEFFRSPGSASSDILYHGNSIPEWFTNRNTQNHVKVELPSNWCFNKFRGFGTCVVFKCKKPRKLKGYSVKNFDGTCIVKSLGNYYLVLIDDYIENRVIGIQDSYMIWLHYTLDTCKWKEAQNFVTFCFEENNEGYEVKECGARLICDEDIQQERDVSMLQGLPIPTQHGGVLSLLDGPLDGPVNTSWSW
ncbi:NB-ARC domains-containing protein, partial [Tanacetum coccineum]